MEAKKKLEDPTNPLNPGFSDAPTAHFRNRPATLTERAVAWFKEFVRRVGDYMPMRKQIRLPDKCK